MVQKSNRACTMSSSVRSDDDGALSHELKLQLSRTASELTAANNRISKLELEKADVKLAAHFEREDAGRAAAERALLATAEQLKVATTRNERERSDERSEADLLAAQAAFQLAQLRETASFARLAKATILDVRDSVLRDRGAAAVDVLRPPSPSGLGGDDCAATLLSDLVQLQAAALEIAAALREEPSSGGATSLLSVDNGSGSNVLSVGSTASNDSGSRDSAQAAFDRRLRLAASGVPRRPALQKARHNRPWRAATHERSIKSTNAGALPGMESAAPVVSYYKLMHR